MVLEIKLEALISEVYYPLLLTASSALEINSSILTISLINNLGKDLMPLNTKHRIARRIINPSFCGLQETHLYLNYEYLVFIKT